MSIKNENCDNFDFYPLGQAIKANRTKRKITREPLAEKLDITDRYLAQIENEGVNPGFELFYTLVAMFDISVDQYFYPDCAPAKSTRRRQIEAMIDRFDDTDLIIIEATANGISEAKYIQNEAASPDRSLSYSVGNEP